MSEARYQRKPYGQRFCGMKRLGERAAFLSTEEKVGEEHERPQTTEPQLFYIVCCAT